MPRVAKFIYKQWANFDLVDRILWTQDVGGPHGLSCGWAVMNFQTMISGKPLTFPTFGSNRISKMINKNRKFTQIFANIFHGYWICKWLIINHWSGFSTSPPVDIIMGRLHGFSCGIVVVREGFEPPNARSELIYSQRPLATWISHRFVMTKI